MKEKLFDEIAEFRQQYHISMMHSWNNEMILYPLSVEIKPRPGDTFRCVVSNSIVATIYTCVCSCFLF
jgi:hypothetical protein